MRRPDPKLRWGNRRMRWPPPELRSENPPDAIVPSKVATDASTGWDGRVHSVQTSLPGFHTPVHRTRLQEKNGDSPKSYRFLGHTWFIVRLAPSRGAPCHHRPVSQIGAIVGGTSSRTTSPASRPRNGARSSTGVVAHKLARLLTAQRRDGTRLAPQRDRRLDRGRAPRRHERRAEECDEDDRRLNRVGGPHSF